MRLLLLSRTASMAQVMSTLLDEAGHRVAWHATTTSVGTEAADFDAWLVDADPPRGDHLTWIRESLDGGTQRPVILFTSRRLGARQLQELNCGPRDCLEKPVDLEHLVARLHALKRRSLDPDAYRVRIGEAWIDLDRQLVTVQGRPVQLTAQEWTVFELLAERPGHIVSKDELASLNHEPASLNHVEFHISRLRRKIGRWAIETIRGRGYRLVP
jgi:two-component system OmpR family response regulator